MRNVVICVYDNPASFSRECWQNGKLLYAYSAEVVYLHQEGRFPPEAFFFGANIGPWKLGQISGDPRAMPEYEGGPA